MVYFLVLCYALITLRGLVNKEMMAQLKGMRSGNADIQAPNIHLKQVPDIV